MSLAHGDTVDLTQQRSPLQRLRDVWRYRELLVNLSRKELKVKYKNSVLGFVWSLLNPALYLVVFTIVFQVILGSAIPYFPIYLLSGLLVWNLFSNGLGAATSSVVNNASLVSKVRFPREILPLAGIGATLVHFFLQATVLLAAVAVFRHSPDPVFLLILPFALFTLLLFLAALGTALAAVNVYLRDTQHLLELALLLWFWLTPIVYQYELIASKLPNPNLGLLNPVTPVVLAFQRGIYGVVTAPDGTPLLPDASVWWYLRNLVIVAVLSSLLMVFALWLFGRLEGDFAESI